MTIHGVDISNYQASWKPTDNDKFVFIKSTEGHTYKSPARANQANVARDRGMVVGFYHFLHPGNIEQQAQYFLDNTPLKDGDLLVCDWEFAGTSNKDKDDFIKALKKLAPKHKVGLYCNTSWWKTNDSTSYCGDFLWMANYGKNPGVTHEVNFWQYSDKPIDQNTGYFDSLAALKTWSLEFSQNDQVPAAPATPEPVKTPSAPEGNTVSIPSIESELTNSKVNPEGLKIWREALAQFPEVKVVWCYSSSTDSDHRNGRCLDLMVTYTGLSRAEQVKLGDRIRAYFVANADRLHVQGIIWNGYVTGFPIGSGTSQPDVTYRGPAGQARVYSEADKHTDHVHVQVSGAKVNSWLAPADPWVWDGVSFPGPERFYIGAVGPWITLLGQRLVVHGWQGYLDGPGPTFTATDQAAVRWWQLSHGAVGSGADGFPGLQSWTELMADPQPVVNEPIPADPTQAPPVVETPVETPPAVVTPVETAPVPASPITEPVAGSQEPGIIDTTKCPETDSTVVTLPVPAMPAKEVPPTVKPGIASFVGVSFNAEWPGFSSTQAKAKSWSIRMPILVKKVAAVKPDLIATQEMGEVEAAQFYGALAKATGIVYNYQRFGPLNTSGWNPDKFDYDKTLEIDTPDYGQYPGRGYVEAWLKDKQGNRIRVGSGHNPVKTGADAKDQEATIKMIVSGVNNENDDWPLIWADDTNNRQSKNVGMWAVLNKYGYEWIVSGIDAVFYNFGAEITKHSVVDLGDGSDHNMLVFTGRTTKK